MPAGSVSASRSWRCAAADPLARRRCPRRDARFADDPCRRNRSVRVTWHPGLMVLSDLPNTRRSGGCTCARTDCRSARPMNLGGPCRPSEIRVARAQLGSACVAQSGTGRDPQEILATSTHFGVGMYRGGTIAEPTAEPATTDSTKATQGLHVIPASKGRIRRTRPPGELLVAACILCRRGDSYLNPTGFSPLEVPGGRVKLGKPFRWPGTTPLPTYPPQSRGWSLRKKPTS